MKIAQSAALSPAHTKQVQALGRLLARLRIAHNVKQSDAAARAGVSRNTAYRIEKGDPGLALGLILRYLDAISPNATLASLLAESDPALTTLAASEARQRARDLTQSEIERLDF